LNPTSIPEKEKINEKNVFVFSSVLLPNEASDKPAGRSGAALVEKYFSPHRIGNDSVAGRHKGDSSLFISSRHLMASENRC